MYLFAEQARLLLRDHKKYGLFTAMLSISDLTCITKGIRYPYYFCRKIDDIVDGDRPLPNCFSSVQQMIESTKQRIGVVFEECNRREWIYIMNHPEAQNSELFIRFFLERFPKSDRQQIVQYLLEYLDSAHSDFERRMHSVALPEADLHAAYEASFSPVQDISLAALGSALRSHELPLLAQLQGRSYALTDLTHEFCRGEINVPLHVLKTAGIDQENVSEIDPWTVPDIRVWALKEIEFCRTSLQEITQILPRDKGEVRMRQALLPLIKKKIDSVSQYLAG